MNRTHASVGGGVHLIDFTYGIIRFFLNLICYDNKRFGSIISPQDNNICKRTDDTRDLIRFRSTTWYGCPCYSVRRSYRYPVMSLHARYRTFKKKNPVTTCPTNVSSRPCRTRERAAGSVFARRVSPSRRKSPRRANKQNTFVWTLLFCHGAVPCTVIKYVAE